MMLARRAFLRATGAAVFAAGSLHSGLCLATPGPARRLKLDNLHTGERLAIDYWCNGSYEPEALQQINHLLRDFRTGDVHPIDPGLLDLLHDLNAKLETAESFKVISGYRSPLTNGQLHERSSGVASKSLHMQGMAMDVRMPGRALAALHDAALILGRGGVGYYPKSDFVHVDVGRVRRWNGV